MPYFFFAMITMAITRLKTTKGDMSVIKKLKRNQGAIGNNINHHCARPVSCSILGVPPLS